MNAWRIRMDFERRKRPFRHLGRVVDIINIILSVVVVTCAVFVALNREENLLLFPVIFLSTALINLALAVKYYKRRDNFRVMTLAIGFLAFFGFGIFTLIVVL